MGVAVLAHGCIEEMLELLLVELVELAEDRDSSLIWMGGDVIGMATEVLEPVCWRANQLGLAIVLRSVREECWVL